MSLDKGHELSAAGPLEKGSAESSDDSLHAVPAALEDAAAIRRLNLKLDLRVLPPLVVLWFFSFIDRVNIGNARIQGLEKDLHMKGNNFNVALCIFFVPFILFEVPSNLVMSKRMVKPSTWLCLQVFVLCKYRRTPGDRHFRR